MSAIKVNPGETYTVHIPSGRVVEEWTEEDFAILGARVEDLRADGYTVTPWGRS